VGSGLGLLKPSWNERSDTLIEKRDLEEDVVTKIGIALNHHHHHHQPTTVHRWT
jgi:hypothetical protein